MSHIPGVYDEGWVAPPRRPTRRRVHRDVPWAIAVILSAPILWYLVGASTLIQNGYLDPYFYTGYINNYGELLQRYGLTYYATRIADIFPQRVLSTAFGYEAGYYLWHYVLVVAGLGSVYALARRRQGVETAVIVTTFLVVCPWFPRAIAWDYIDGAAITFVLIAIFFVLGSRARPVVRWSAAGAFFSLAVNSNLFMVTVIGAFVGAWLVFGFSGRSLRRRTTALAWLAGGFVAVQLVLATFMALTYPKAGFFFARENFGISSQLLKTNTEWLPLGTVLRDFPFVWVPILGFLAVGAFALTFDLRPLPPHRRAFIRLTALFFALCGGAFVALQLAHQSVLYPWYVDYLIPAFVLGAIVIVGELFGRLVRNTRRAVAVAATGGLFVSFLVQRAWTPDIRNAGRIIFILGIATVVLVACRRWIGPFATVVGVVVMLAITPFAFLVGSTSYYTWVASGTGRDAEWDVFRLAHSFQDHVLSAVPLDRTVGFWYGNDPSLSSIQSMFLYDFTRVFDDRDPMPNANSTLLFNIKNFDYLVLMGFSPGDVAAGTRALCDAGQSLRRVAGETLHTDTKNLTYIVLLRELSGGCRGIGGTG